MSFWVDSLLKAHVAGFFARFVPDCEIVPNLWKHLPTAVRTVCLNMMEEKGPAQMDVRIGFRMGFAATLPTPTILLLYVHPDVSAGLRNPERLNIQSDSGVEVPIEDFVDCFGNRSARIMIPPGNVTLSYNNVISRPDEPEPVVADARQHPVEELPSQTLPFLLPSRYCEVDRMGGIAWELFENTDPGWARVQAVNNWVHNHIEFGYHHASPTMTAYDAYQNRRGVCRDYTHLAITLCRCLNIPARYATGYLGEINVPAGGGPMDFAAFYEVYLGGQWHAFDARNNARRYGRTLMARGRDAADTALTTSFNNMALTEFVVWTEQINQ